MGETSIEELKEVQVKCLCGEIMTGDYLKSGSLGFVRELTCRHCGRRLTIEQGIPLSTVKTG